MIHQQEYTETMDKAFQLILQIGLKARVTFQKDLATTISHNIHVKCGSKTATFCNLLTNAGMDHAS